MPPSELEIALGAALPATSLPQELPLAHLTAARYLRGILDAKYLLPRHCKVFGQKLLYFSYGGVFYRAPKEQSENVTELPVAMVFTPEVMDACCRLFPFDSGAMARKLYGGKWYTAMEPFEKRFSICTGKLSTAARLLVHHLYRTNSRYVGGRPARGNPSWPATLSLLHTFLDQDLSGTCTVPCGIDHRQRSIELLSDAPVSIANELIWIGLPHHRLARTMKAIRELTRTVPQIYPYRFSRNFNPDEIAGELQRAARDQVVERYLE